MSKFNLEIYALYFSRKIHLYFRLAGFVYEYLVHSGATKTAESFKGEVLSV